MELGISLWAEERIRTTERMENRWILLDTINREFVILQNEETARRIFDQNFVYDYLVKEGIVYESR